MRIKHLIILCLASAFCLVSCFDPGDSKFTYTNLYGFGDVRGTWIRLEPDGQALQITEDLTDKKWIAAERIFFCCDILDATDENTFQIRLKSYEPVTITPALFKSESDPDFYGSDAVSFYQDWGLDDTKQTISLAAVTTSLKTSSKVHRVNLVFDDERSNKDTLYFELRHQGFGESFENEDYDEKDFQVNTHYLTFDLSETIPSDAGSSIILRIDWDWLVSNGAGNLERERKHEFATGRMALK